MKKLKYHILFVILIMTIGIAAVTTNIVLSGSTSLTSNPDDFDVYFTSVHQPSGTSEARIDVHSKTNFSFFADLSAIGDYVNISFNVYNSSRIYDADVELNCDFDSEYINLAYELDEDTIIVNVEPSALNAAKECLAEMGIEEFLTCEVTLVPNDYVTLEGEDKEKFEMLLDVLEELEDVQNVYHNVKL